MSEDDFDLEELRRKAFRAGFLAVLHIDEAGRRWTFDDFNVAADLEPEAYKAWRKQQETK
jgi:hypothetical protein